MNGVIDIKFSNEATEEPLSVDAVKVPLEIDGTYHDDYLKTLISTARRYAEKYLNRSLISRHVVAILKNESGGQLLPYGPPSGSVTGEDYQGRDVEINVTGEGNFFYLDAPCFGPLTLEYDVEGYTTETLPEVFKAGLMQAVCFWFENRGDGTASLPKVARETMKYERIKDNIMFW